MTPALTHAALAVFAPLAAASLLAVAAPLR